jgi:spermidine/putrescine transport system substrate-binding protein
MKQQKSNPSATALTLPKTHRRNFLAATGALGALSATGLAARPVRASGKLVFYNWSTYIDEETIPEFSDQFGVEVTEDFFADNDELFNKLRTGNPGYDVIVPTNDYVHRMIEAGMIQELDHGRIANVKNIGQTFLNPAFDPGRKYSLPYMWGTIGIGYRKSAVDGTIDSWKDIFDSDRFSGRLAILGDADSMLSSVKKYLGYSLNDTDPDLIKRCGEVLKKQKPHITEVADDNGQDLLAAGEVDVAVEWNGDIAQLIVEDDDIGYVIPKEGGLLWEDALAIPTGAPNVDNAYSFINQLLDADVGARIADYIQYATPNTAALRQMSSEYRNNPAIFPPESVLATCETATYKGEAYIENISRTWDEFLAA